MLILTNCDIFTGTTVLYSHALVVDGPYIVGILPLAEVQQRPGAEIIDLEGCAVAPGFVDIQVNGGGGLLFNDDPSPETIHTIARAHRRFGTTSLLPTYITGPEDGMRRAIAAVQECVNGGESGVLGVHLEGPHLNPGKAGVHDAAFIRRASETDLAIACSLIGGVTLVTLAPEVVNDETLMRLRERGVVLAAGHSNATFIEASQAFGAGLRLVTHLFNAMSAFQSREPGLVGAALYADDVWCSVIADGHHIHFASLEIAWRAKKKGRMFLVTDAMPPVGGSSASFQLGPYSIEVRDGRCVTPDNVLAGSALDMATAVRNCIQKVGIPMDEALRMASTYPAEFLGLGQQLGMIAPGYRADLVIFNNQIRVSAVVSAGVYEAIA